MTLNLDELYNYCDYYFYLNDNILTLNLLLSPLSTPKTLQLPPPIHHIRLVWCPHCARQKELLGREAFQYIKYVECSPKGFGAQPLLCNKKDVDGYPTWVFKDKTVLGGERPLEDFAKQVKYAKFDPQLEQNVPPSLGSSACK